MWLHARLACVRDIPLPRRRLPSISARIANIRPKLREAAREFGAPPDLGLVGLDHVPARPSRQAGR